MVQKSCISCGKQLAETEEGVCSYCGALQGESVPVFVPQSEIKRPKPVKSAELSGKKSLLEIISGLYFHPTSTIEPSLLHSFRLSIVIMLIIATLNVVALFCFYQGITIDFRVDPIPSIGGIPFETIIRVIFFVSNILQFFLRFFSWLLFSIILWILFLVFTSLPRGSFTLKDSLKVLGVTNVPWIFLSILRLVLFGGLLVFNNTGQIIITGSQWNVSFLQFSAQYQYLLMDINFQFGIAFSLVAVALEIWASYLIYCTLQNLNVQVEKDKLKLITIVYTIISIFFVFLIPILAVPLF